MAGNLTLQQCGNVFANKKAQASANYGVSTAGQVGLYVQERDRSWATANAANDHRAVTIEVANCSTGGNWPVSDAALNTLIDLCVDICKRNNIKALNYTGDKSGNLTMHKWFAATACPGPYLASKFPYIAQQVNAKLNNNIEFTTTAAIVDNLVNRGIITSRDLWMNKAVVNSNSYWLAYKIANKTTNGVGSDLQTVNDIIWELNYRGIITDTKLWSALLTQDANLYWLARKCCLLTVNK